MKGDNKYPGLFDFLFGLLKLNVASLHSFSSLQGYYYGQQVANATSKNQKKQY